MDLIERLRAVEWEETDECDRMPDDPTHKCVFVDMRPDDFRALLREAAAALRAVREVPVVNLLPRSGPLALDWIAMGDADNESQVSALVGQRVRLVPVGEGE